MRICDFWSSSEAKADMIDCGFGPKPVVEILPMGCPSGGKDLVGPPPDQVLCRWPVARFDES